MCYAATDSVYMKLYGIVYMCSKRLENTAVRSFVRHIGVFEVNVRRNERDGGEGERAMFFPAYSSIAYRFCFQSSRQLVSRLFLYQ